MNFARPRRAELGFTLMEVLVSLAVTTLILMGALSVLDTARHTTRRTMGIASAQQSGSYAMQELSANLKRAGFMIGKRNAILKGNLVAGTSYISTWNDYNASTHPNGIWSLNPAGGRTYLPVPGTDGITVRFSNDQPPIHVCAMPSANGARIELAYDPSVPYPVAGDEVDFITTTSCLPGGNPDNEAYLVHATIRQDPGANNPGGNCSCTGQNCNMQNSTSCVAMDPLCNQIYANRFDACYKVILDNNFACDLCQVGPTYMISANSATYWVSTEDGSGNVAVSRPVLIGREGLGTTKPARIIATDVEDLQLNYSLDPLDTAAAGAASGADGTPPMLDNPTGVQLGAVRAVRVNVVARTPTVDLMARNQAYCASRTPAFRSLFTRPAVEDRPAPTAGAGYCDGFRRSLYTQTMYLANMRSNPL